MPSQSVIQLYGPDPNGIPFEDYNNWSSPGAAFSASTQTLHFDKNLTITRARFSIVYAVTGDFLQVNFIIMDDISNPASIYQTQLTPSPLGQGLPTSHGYDVTYAMQQYAKAGIGKQIGYWLYGKGKTYSVRLELTF